LTLIPISALIKYTNISKQFFYDKERKMSIRLQIGLLIISMIIFVAAPVRAEVILTPTVDTWMYVFANGYQGGHDGPPYGEDVTIEGWWDLGTGPVDNPSASAEDDPIPFLDDPPLLDGLSSFAIGTASLTDLGGWSNPDSSDIFQLYVNNQATQAPVIGDPESNPYGPYGWGESGAQLFVTYDTTGINGSNPGDPMTITLSLYLSEDLYADSESDDFALYLAYSLGTGLSADPPYDHEEYWDGAGPINHQEIEFSDSIEYTGVIGDQVNLVIILTSIASSQHGYTWTKATLDPGTGTLVEGTQSMMLQATQSAESDSEPLTSVRIAITATTPNNDEDGDGYDVTEDCNDNDPSINPGATEVCDGVDNNCDEYIDDNYVFGGFQQPINSDNSSIFKAGRTIPVKISLLDCSGNNITSAPVSISIYKIINTIEGTEEELDVDASGNANTGNMFRVADDLYIYNLSTKDYSAGTYRVAAEIDNGETTSVRFSLK
jgi:hypothetical protein